MDYKKAVVAVCCLLVLVSLGIDFSRLVHAGFMVNDDIEMDLLAARIRAHDARAYFDEAASLATIQGRVYFYASTFFFVLPHLFENAAARTALILAIHLAAVRAMAVFLGFYIGRLGGALFMGMVFCTLPFWWGYYPVNALPVYYQVPVASFFGAMICHVKLHRSGPGDTGRAQLAVCRDCLLLFAMMFYEALYAPFLLVLGAVTWAEAPAGQRKVTALMRRNGQPLAIIGLWFGVYVMYRRAHPVIYPGALIDAGGVLVPLMRHLWYYGVRSLPGANVLPVASPAARGFLSVIGANAGLGALIQAALLIVLVILAAVASPRGTNRETDRPAARGMWLAGIALLCGMTVPLPLAFSAKYRDVPHLWAPYIPGYFMFLAYAAGFTGVLVWLLQGRSYALVRRAAALVIATAMAAATLSTGVANNVIARRQRVAEERWRLVNALIRSGVLDRLPDGGTLVAPGLWEGFDRRWPGYDSYWTEYFSLRLPHKITVAREPGAVRDVVRSGKAVYYLGELPRPDDLPSRAVLSWRESWTRSERPMPDARPSRAVLLASINNPGPDGSLGGENSVLISEWRWNALELAYTSHADGSVARVPVPIPKRTRAGFETAVATPRIVFGSAPL
jgi:hypothetical protein